MTNPHLSLVTPTTVGGSAAAGEEGSDEQLDAIMRAAQPLASADRERFVEAVTAALQGREIGDAGGGAAEKRDEPAAHFAMSASRLKRIPGRGGGEFQISNVGAET
jgi:hypothetical protein